MYNDTDSTVLKNQLVFDTTQLHVGDVINVLVKPTSENKLDHYISLGRFMISDINELIICMIGKPFKTIENILNSWYSHDISKIPDYVKICLNPVICNFKDTLMEYRLSVKHESKFVIIKVKEGDIV
jgi:hypothetical protein